METYYAKIVEGIVTSVEVVNDGFVADNPTRYKNHIKAEGVGKGYLYSNDVFIGLKPYNSWTLVDNVWTAPKLQPEGNYRWDENTTSWIIKINKE